MTDINEIKSKYPLAVEALKGNEYKGVGDKITNTTDSDCYCMRPTFLLHSEKNVDFITKRQLSKMLADILNLIAKQ